MIWGKQHSTSPSPGSRVWRKAKETPRSSSGQLETTGFKEQPVHSQWSRSLQQAYGVSMSGRCIGGHRWMLLLHAESTVGDGRTGTKRSLERRPLPMRGDHIMTIATGYLSEHEVPLFLSRFSALPSQCIWSAPPRVVMAGGETDGQHCGEARDRIHPVSSFNLHEARCDTDRARGLWAKATAGICR